MPRIVQASQRPPTIPGAATFAAGGSAPEIPPYDERVAQYIPAEVVAAYIAMLNLLGTVIAPGEAKLRTALAVVAFLAGFVATILYLGRFPAPPADKQRHLIISTIAFVFWAYAFPLGIFVEFKLYHPAIAGFALVLFTLYSGTFKPKT